MRPTRVSTLVALLVGTAALAWGALRISVNRGGHAAGADLDRAGRRRVTRRRRAADGRRAAVAGWRGRRSDRTRSAMARLAVLGKASAHVGPLVGGLYAGYLVVAAARAGHRAAGGTAR